MKPQKANSSIIALPNISQLLQEAEEDVRKYESSPETLRAYAADWSHYLEYCQSVQLAPGEIGADPLPPNEGLLLSYFQWMGSNYAKSTIERRRFGVQKHFEHYGYKDVFSAPAFKTLFKVISRKKAGEGTEQPKPITRNVLEMLLEANDKATRYRDKGGLRNLRNRAILTLGFAAGGRRCSEIAALNVPDVSFDEAGMDVLVRKSKTDQVGRGHIAGVKYGKDPSLCAVRSCIAWIEAAKIEEGPLFRSIQNGGYVEGRLSAHWVSQVVKKLAQLAGLPYRNYSGHSMRHGFIAQASINGEPVQNVMNQSGHKSPKMVLHYMRSANPKETGAQVL